MRRQIDVNRNGPLALVLALSVSWALQAAPPGAEEEMRKADALMADKQWAAATELMLKLAKDERLDDAGWSKLCICFMEKGDVPRAAETCRTAMSQHGAGVDVAVRLACFLGRNRDTDGAVLALNKAIDAGFSDRALLESSPDLEGVRRDDRYAYLQRRLAGASVPLVGGLGFLAGSWQCIDSGGSPEGRASIEKCSRNYGLKERLEGPGGQTSEGLYYLDSVEKKWKYVSITSGGDVVQAECPTIGLAVRFDGSHRGADGRIRPFRMTFTPGKDGRVRKQVEQSKDEGKSWITYADGWFAPRQAIAP